MNTVVSLSQLSKIVKRPKKRIGRGHGSGKVKTAGRGTKGQNARGTVRPGFEGGQLSIIKRLPYLRGKMRNSSQHPRAYAIAVSKLNKLPSGTTVTLESLRKYHMIDREITRVKIVTDGSLTQVLTVNLPCSASAKMAIEKAGGKVLA